MKKIIAFAILIPCYLYSYGGYETLRITNKDTEPISFLFFATIPGHRCASIKVQPGKSVEQNRDRAFKYKNYLVTVHKGDKVVHKRKFKLLRHDHPYKHFVWDGKRLKKTTNTKKSTALIAQFAMQLNEIGQPCYWGG